MHSAIRGSIALLLLAGLTAFHGLAHANPQAEEGLENLTEDHWSVINYIREYFLEKKLAPMVRRVCKHTGFSLKHIFELFPSGPAKGACKLAGLPKPDGCV